MTPLMRYAHIFTNNKRVKKARSFVIEFLLVNHPLDCPICDQGGECDLQDITSVFGNIRGRYYESYKRAVNNYLNLGPFIKTVMTRCIHCTRCVRFLSKIAGNYDLGVIGRGYLMEISTYLNDIPLLNELSSNIIDLCPVGALTSMPYAFKARPWELTTFESIDLMDAVASSIRIDVFNNRVIRILPYFNENRNEEWISNKARFLYDSFYSTYRLFEPQIKILYENVIEYFIKISWENAIKLILNKLNSENYDIVMAFTGPFFDIKSSYYLKSFFNNIGCCNYNYQSNYKFSFDFRFSYLLTIPIIELEYIQIAFFFNINMRLESPILNLKLRKSYLKNKKKFLAISLGTFSDYLTFPIINLGNSLFSFISLFEGKNLFWRFLFLNNINKLPFQLYNLNQKFYFITFLGENLISRYDGEFFFKNMMFFTKKILQRHWEKELLYSVNVISNNLGRISAFELGLLPGINENNFNKNHDFFLEKKNKFLYLCGIDNFNFFNTLNIKNSFIVYQGNFSGWDFFYKNINLVLPSKLYIEQDSFFFNIEGNFIKSPKILNIASKLALPDYLIFKGLFFFKNLKFKNNFSIITNFFSFYYFFYNASCLFFKNNFYLNYLQKINRKHIDNLGAYININKINYFSIYNKFNYYKQRFFIGIFHNNLLNYYESNDPFSMHSKQISLAANRINVNLFKINLYI